MGKKKKVSGQADKILVSPPLPPSIFPCPPARRRASIPFAPVYIRYDCVDGHCNRYCRFSVQEHLGRDLSAEGGPDLIFRQVLRSYRPYCPVNSDISEFATDTCIGGRRRYSVFTRQPDAGFDCPVYHPWSQDRCSAARNGSEFSLLPEFVPPLIDLLAAGTCRAVALQALAAYGAQVQDELQKTLLEETGDIVIKQNIPRVLRQIANQVSIDILLEALDQVHPALKYPIIKALNKLHQDPSLHIDEKRIHTSLIHEAQTYYEMQKI